MHVYSCDGDDRRIIPFVLAAISFAVIVVLRQVVARLGMDPAFNVSVFSSFAIYGLLHIAFDRHVWKWRIIRSIGGVSAPDLGGHWKGVLKTSVTSLSKEYPVELEIHQTWSRINILLQGEMSTSESKMASIRTVSPLRYELVWEYLARPKSSEEGSRFSHFGVTRLAIQFGSGAVAASGGYYTEQLRDTFGTIELSRS